MNACRSCGAAIKWASTPGGKPMPLDAKPNPDGNVILRGGHALVMGSQLGLFDGETLYASHFVTCPDAASWRR